MTVSPYDYDSFLPELSLPEGWHIRDVTVSPPDYELGDTVVLEVSFRNFRTSITIGPGPKNEVLYYVQKYLDFAKSIKDLRGEG